MTTTVHRDEDPERIPHSWVDAGRQEHAAGPQVRAYAVRAAPTLVESDPEYVVLGNGARNGRRTVEWRLEVLYVARDTAHAFVDHVDGRYDPEADEVRPTDRFRAIRGVRPGEFKIVESVHSRDLYGRDLRALYGDVVDHDLDWPARDIPSFSTGSDLRADGGEQ